MSNRHSPAELPGSPCSLSVLTCAELIPILPLGTRPSKKTTNVRDVKRYLNVTTISADGLLIVKRNDPLCSTRECIVVQRQVLDGRLTALHLQLSHPTAYQLKKVVSRYFYALDIEKAVDNVTTGCHTCAALKHVPNIATEQTTTDPPSAVGATFAADIMKRASQLILAVRECVSSYTVSVLVKDERSATLRDALIQLCAELCPLDCPSALIRTEPAPAFKSLVNDELLARYRIMLELGRAKNLNKNPVAERAIQELEEELLRQDPHGEPISPTLLAVATARLNTRIRFRGLSAREIWTHRDQFTNKQIPVADQTLILQQHAGRLKNHPYSERSKAPIGSIPTPPSIAIGDLVYLYADRAKHHSHDRYLVTSVEGDWCYLSKFVGSQLRQSSYRVKKSDCFKVPSSLRTQHKPPTGSYSSDSSDDEEYPQAQ